MLPWWELVNVVGFGLGLLVALMILRNQRRTLDAQQNNDDRQKRLVAALAKTTEVASVLKDTELRYRVIVDNITEGMWDWDLATNYEYLSPKFKAHFGYTDLELPNEPDSWKTIIHPIDKERAERLFREHVDESVPYDLLVRYTHKNGSTVWILCKGFAIRDDSGTPIRMIGIHVDVTRLIAGYESNALENYYGAGAV